MNLQQLLASLLNPNGSQQAMPVRQMAPSQVGDGNNPSLLLQAQQRLAQPQQQAFAMQAPQAQPIAQGAPQARPMANGGLLGGGGIGGLLGNIFNPNGGSEARVAQTLQQWGTDPGVAAIATKDPGILRALVQQHIQGGGQTEFDQRAAAAKQYGLDPSSPEYRNYVLGNKLGSEGDGQTSDQKEYQYAVQHDGFKGSFMDFMVKMKEAGRNLVNIDTGAKLPTGYMWNDPNDQTKGVHPIEGGPATVLPAESAGRIGLADTFIQNLDDKTVNGVTVPGILSKVKAGQVTGPLDYLNARNNSSSDSAETYRQIQSGTDALQRMLTGAGMPATEAANYAYRYLPVMTDTAESLTLKIQRLKSELTSIKEETMRGRGGTGSPSADTGTPKAAPSVGETRYGYRFKGGDPSEPSNWEKAK